MFRFINIVDEAHWKKIVISFSTDWSINYATAARSCSSIIIYSAYIHTCITALLKWWQNACNIQSAVNDDAEVRDFGQRHDELSLSSRGNKTTSLVADVCLANHTNRCECCHYDVILTVVAYSFYCITTAALTRDSNTRLHKPTA